jgi:hypothetical protein
MAVRKVRYVALEVSSRAGQGAQILGALDRAGIDLLAFTGFPTGRGRAQVDLVTDDLAGVRRVAKKLGWRPGKAKQGFLIQGRNQVGAVYRQIKKLADRGISVTAADAVAAGRGQYGMILWVKPRDYARAGRALGAR